MLRSPKFFLLMILGEVLEAVRKYQIWPLLSW